MSPDRYDHVKSRLFETGERKGMLGELLKARGYVTPQQLDECLDEQKRLREAGQEYKLGQLLLKRGYLSTARFLEILSAQDAEPGSGLMVVAPPPPPPAVAGAPLRIGRYVIKREIARGGMGVVYEAEDAELKRRVALKILREGEASATVTARLHREAAIAAQLQHPNIVGIHEVGTTRDSLGKVVHFIAMEYVEGTTLADAMASGRTAKGELLRMLEEVALAVAYAHTRGVIHRDLKPGNVLLEKGGRVVLTDFGLARADTFRTQLTRSQAVMGTPQYMAPEQVEGRTKDIDSRTDVYALGVILYEILTGTPPFMGETPAALYRKILQDEPRRPSTLRRHIAGDLEVICLKAMEKDRGRRYASAEELAKDLARFRRGEVIDARPPSVLYRLRKGFMRRRTLVLGAGGVVAGSVILAVLIWRNQQHVDESESYRQLRNRLDPIEGAIRDGRNRFYLNPLLDIRSRLDTVEEALAELEALAADPRYGAYGEVWALLGVGSYVVGNEVRAEDALRRAVEKSPKDGKSLYYLGLIHLERSMTVRLIVDAVGGIDPEQKRRSRELAASGRGYLELGIRHWVAAEEIDRIVGQAYMALAEDRLEDVAKLTREGIERFGQTRRVEELHNLQGWIRSHSDAEGAVAAYRRALEARPHYPWASFCLGNVLARQGRTVEAMAEYDRALRVNPRLRAAWVNRGKLRETVGELDKALEDYAAALKLDVDDEMALTNRAAVYIRQGKPDLALQDLRKPLASASPGVRAAALANRAQIHVDRKDWNAVAEDAKAVLTLNPESAVGFYFRGRALEAKDDVEGAVREYGKAVDRDASRGDASLRRGILRWQRLRDEDGAIADFTEAVRRSPTLKNGFKYRGLILLQRSELDRGVEDLSRVLQIDPADYEAYFNRGVARAQVGRRAEAVADFRKVVELAPAGSDYQKQARKYLERLSESE